MQAIFLISSCVQCQNALNSYISGRGARKAESIQNFTDAFRFPKNFVHWIERFSGNTVRRQKEGIMGKTVRLSDIAKRAGVSTVTVSKALSGQKGVSSEKRSLIEHLARDMGYQKTVASTGQKKGYTIGVVVSDRFLNGNQSFYWTYYQELSRCATRKGNLPVLKIITREEEDRKNISCVTGQRQIRGYIFLGSFCDGFRKELQTAVNVPCIFIDSVGPGLSIVTDNMRMAFEMTNYLFSMGHRKIGFVGTRAFSEAVDDRYMGYLKSLIEHGVKPDPAYVLDDRDRTTGAIEPDKFRLDPDNMPTAFLCNGGIAASVLSGRLDQAGFPVPGSVSIAQFEDFLPEHIAGIELTSCRVNIEEIAERAITVLVRQIEGAVYPQVTLEIAGSIVLRSSVKKIGEPVSFI